MSIITMEDLESGMCRWPHGHIEDEDFRFCGDKTDPALPYCEKHMVMAQSAARKPKAS